MKEIRILKKQSYAVETKTGQVFSLYYQMEYDGEKLIWVYLVSPRVVDILFDVIADVILNHTEEILPDVYKQGYFAKYIDVKQRENRVFVYFYINEAFEGYDEEDRIKFALKTDLVRMLNNIPKKLGRRYKKYYD